MSYQNVSTGYFLVNGTQATERRRSGVKLTLGGFNGDARSDILWREDDAMRYVPLVGERCCQPAVPNVAA